MSEGSVTIRDSLLNSPTNLKEAIDWILRVTNKDGQETLDNTAGGNCLCPLSQAVVTVLRDVRVKDYLDHQEEKDLVSGILSSIETIGGVRTTRSLIEEVASKLADLIGYQKEETYDESSSDESSESGTSGSDDESSTVDAPDKKVVMGDKGIGCNGSGCSHTKAPEGGGCDGYQSSYNKEASISGLKKKVKDDSTQDSWTTIAKIFLGCIPLVFSGLSYLYWMAYARNGFKSNNGGTGDVPLKYYVMRMGFEWDQWRCKSTDNGVEGVELSELIDVFETCQVLGAEMVDKTDNKPGDNYAQYLDKLRTEAGMSDPGSNDFEGNGDGTVQMEDTTEHALLKLNILCTGYFRALNQPYRVHRRNHRLPRTIREILYWLSCVQYCPVFRVLVQKMQELCQRVGGGVTFYSGYIGGLDVSGENCASYLLGAALVAPMVLLSIQDTIESLVPQVGGTQTVTEPSVDAKTEDEGTEGQKASHEMTYQEKIDRLASTSTPVPIHDLYSNSLFEFRFPMSETESYYLLQDCLVALYYQLYFLRLQCNWHRQTFGADGFGWAFCRYGDGVNSTGCGSWICPKAGAATQSQGGGDGTYAKVLDKHTNECGQNGSGTPSPSPLQAFLCDCLPGFTCSRLTDDRSGYKKSMEQFTTERDTKQYNECYPPFLEHRRHCPPGQYCPIPMGFRECFRTAAAGNGMVGVGIDAVLDNYANYYVSVSGLYQITRCICSLTRRVPRSTGTLYGFFFGLPKVYDGQATKFKEALNTELKCCPGWRNPEDLMNVVKDWTGSNGDDHQKDDKSKHAKPSLCSLTECDGKDKSSSTTCGKYIYPLSGSLYNSLATQFCETYVSWIVHLTKTLQSGLQKLLEEFVKIDCSKSGCSKKGGGSHCCEGGKDHGKNCECKNVVECAGVLGLFYRFGFMYLSPGMLCGKKGGPRTCKQFHTQINNVIKGELFTNLFAAINDFKYTTRLPFGLMIFGFWSIVLVYLLWSMTVNLDLMHIQSHWRSPRSHLVPLQRILADGSRKGFCRMGYFQEGTGDRLLSQGISDLYL
ncbi:variant erythrocyte surface antigen beta subunit, putative [Babesia ovis]|uniref:Variant erythrocyte surface antigen beta subunit, putative n=1 Tax=Babesia ovis TaxID=5869 RepID=A0A9W5WU43_BABOV|nr:variant erythrocyte surface antigen beta subunit, putative [Babesia ovis]